MVLLSILGEGFLLYQHLSTWQIIMVVVFPILMSASATFLITMFTLMCWRKHKRKSLTNKLKYMYDFALIIIISVSSIYALESFDRIQEAFFQT